MNKFTKQQIANYRSYEKVRSGGRYNMFDPMARVAAGLTREEYAFVMDNYSELRAQAEGE